MIETTPWGFVFRDLQPGKYMFSAHALRGGGYDLPGDFTVLAKEDEDQVVASLERRSSSARFSS